ncbi:MAG: peptide chain release factor N(5)-glutamine methyltransferase [Chitinispirillales bacterium]|jgi:release factor glutamine methyltransferase|nr:peptide chain release factor N(5)-glutamine methyltransferase [Chitinispirillales bacterium]
MIIELLRNIKNQLTPISGDLAQADAELIIEQSLNISKAQLYTGCSIRVDKDDVARINTIVERHLQGEPLPYIFGRAYFYDREFFVSGDVLIPRPDTETLVEAVFKSEQNHQAAFIDLGTGSGILAAVLTAHRPAWSAVAVDVSLGALRAAARNVALADDRGGYPRQSVSLVCADMFDAIKPKKQFDFAVSNPPYIPSRQVEALDKSVADYEPRLALDGGGDGLDYYRVISKRAGMYLKDMGRAYLEIGYDQGDSIPTIFRSDGWTDIAVIKDLAGRDRVLTAVSPYRF